MVCCKLISARLRRRCFRGRNPNDVATFDRDFFGLITEACIAIFGQNSELSCLLSGQICQTQSGENSCGGSVLGKECAKHREKKQRIIVLSISLSEIARNSCEKKNYYQ